MHYHTEARHGESVSLRKDSWNCRRGEEMCFESKLDSKDRILLLRAFFVKAALIMREDDMDLSLVDRSIWS